MDPALIAERTRLAQGELASATAVIEAFHASDSGELSGPLVHELLEGVGGLTTLLGHVRHRMNASSCTARRACTFAITAAKKVRRSRHLCAWGCFVSEGDSNLLRWAATQST